MRKVWSLLTIAAALSIGLAAHAGDTFAVVVLVAIAIGCLYEATQNG